MKIKNPTKDTIKVQINGNIYEIEGNGELFDIPQVDAEYWKKNIHHFMIISEENEEEETDINQTIDLPVEDKEVISDEEVTTDDDTETTTKEDPIDLNELSRKKLDEVAKQMDLNPEDYKNRKEVIEAIIVKEKE
ncbi:MAG: hypothetical protein GWP19_02630 [Planctomycetia bacterium]|nr:hypothetical protein [Planctomycetia bacterium]